MYINNLISGNYINLINNKFNNNNDYHNKRMRV